MKRFAWAGSLAACFLAAAPAPASTVDEWSSLVAEALVRHVAAQLAVSGSDVEIEWLGLGRGLACPTSAQLVFSARPGEDFRGHADVRLTALQGGTPCDEIRLRPRLRVWTEVLVADRAVAAGGLVTLRRARVPADQVDGAVVPPGSGPWEARVALDEGEAVTVSRVRPVPDAREGDPVTILALRGALVVKADGKLLSDGSRGARVRAVNLAAGTVVEGVLETPAIVLVGGSR